MSKNQKYISLKKEEVLDRFNVDVNSGILIYKKGNFKNKIAGSIHQSGYLVIGNFSNKMQYRIHDLIWLVYNNEISNFSLMHLDNNRQNNSISNLTEMISFNNEPLTQELLKTQLIYNKDTGIFTRNCYIRSGNINDIVGFVDGYGYIIIYINGKQERAHRLAWLYEYGVWPSDQLDHINGIKDDNRICNLREATNKENRQNIKIARSTNQSGYLGVSCHASGKFQSTICKNYKQIHLGIYDTAEEAHMVYLDAKRKIHEFNTI